MSHLEREWSASASGRHQGEPLEATRFFILNPLPYLSLFLLRIFALLDLNSGTWVAVWPCHLSPAFLSSSAQQHEGDPMCISAQPPLVYGCSQNNPVKEIEDPVEELDCSKVLVAGG